MASRDPRISTAKFYFNCVKDKEFYYGLIAQSLDYFLVYKNYDFTYKNLKKLLGRKTTYGDYELMAAKKLSLYYLKTKQNKRLKYLIKLTRKKFSKIRSNEIVFKEIMAVERFLGHLKRKNKIFSQKLSFPEAKFNKALKGRLSKINSYTKISYRISPFNPKFR